MTTFGAMMFVVTGRGQPSMNTLKLCAPPNIARALDAQRRHLTTIHDTGHFADLGTGGKHQWYLAVWSKPEDRVCLIVRPEPLRRMSFTEGLQFGLRVMQRVPLGNRTQIAVMPRDVLDGNRQWDQKYELRAAGNAYKGRPWHHGLV